MTVAVSSAEKSLSTKKNQQVAGGDSGSLIVTQNDASPTALLSAGSSSTTIGNPIQDVTAAFANRGSIVVCGGSQKHCRKLPDSQRRRYQGDMWRV